MRWLTNDPMNIIIDIDSINVWSIISNDGQLLLLMVLLLCVVLLCVLLLLLIIIIIIINYWQ